mmetsp:Transcript_36494/g.82915  ORF Transcript_36494/g.82915 Transcript_36494/m.82915 type:complete len:477 (+) Transcript_36494:1095-2525(+)
MALMFFPLSKRGSTMYVLSTLGLLALCSSSGGTAETFATALSPDGTGSEFPSKRILSMIPCSSSTLSVSTPLAVRSSPNSAPSSPPAPLPALLLAREIFADDSSAARSASGTSSASSSSRSASPESDLRDAAFCCSEATRVPVKAISRIMSIRLAALESTPSSRVSLCTNNDVSIFIFTTGSPPGASSRENRPAEHIIPASSIHRTACSSGDASLSLTRSNSMRQCSMLPGVLSSAARSSIFWSSPQVSSDLRTDSSETFSFARAKSPRSSFICLSASPSRCFCARCSTSDAASLSRAVAISLRSESILAWRAFSVFSLTAWRTSSIRSVKEIFCSSMAFCSAPTCFDSTALSSRLFTSSALTRSSSVATASISLTRCCAAASSALRRAISLRSFLFIPSASASPSLSRMFAPDAMWMSLLTKRRSMSLVRRRSGYASMRERGSAACSHSTIFSTSTVRSSRPKGGSVGPAARKSE